MSNVHWTSLSPNVSLKVVFLFQSFLVITVWFLKQLLHNSPSPCIFKMWSAFFVLSILPEIMRMAANYIKNQDDLQDDLTAVMFRGTPCRRKTFPHWGHIKSKCFPVNKFDVLLDTQSLTSLYVVSHRKWFNSFAVFVLPPPPVDCL